MIKQRAAAVVAVVGLALVAMVAAPPAADASHACPSGHACLYDAQHRLLFAEDGNANVGYHMPYGGHVWNNGYAFPGADHINLTVAAFGSRYVICLHYGRWTLSQPDPTVAIIWEDAVVTGWRWRGECSEAEENWRQY